MIYMYIYIYIWRLLFCSFILILTHGGWCYLTVFCLFAFVYALRRPPLARATTSASPFFCLHLFILQPYYDSMTPTRMLWITMVVIFCSGSVAWGRQPWNIRLAALASDLYFGVLGIAGLACWLGWLGWPGWLCWLASHQPLWVRSEMKEQNRSRHIFVPIKPTKVG